LFADDDIFPMTSIFINYRRDDTSGYSGRLEERLASTFGNDAVFMDLGDIHPGTNFVRAIDESLARCDVMIVLIGRRWLEAEDASGRRRLDKPDDFVRLEIAKALERKMRILPVLVSSATMPSASDLPAPIAGLASIQALELSDERWDYDCEQLINAIGGARRSTNRKLWMAMTVAILAVAGIIFALMKWNATPTPSFAGEWVADVRYDFGAQISERFVFREDGRNLSGVASFLGVDRAILEGKIEKDQITFITRTEEMLGDDRRQTQHHYRGTLDNGEIRLVMQTVGGSSDHPPVEVIAKRKADASP
jgi:hypothetical protein